MSGFKEKKGMECWENQKPEARNQKGVRNWGLVIDSVVDKSRAFSESNLVHSKDSEGGAVRFPGPDRNPVCSVARYR